MLPLNQTTSLEPAFLEIADAEAERIGQWFYKTPFLISKDRIVELTRLQKLLYSTISFFVQNYRKFDTLLPLSERANTILEITSQYPYRVGSYRPDYVISQENEILVCEIGTRFPLDGFFNGCITEIIASKLVRGTGIDFIPEMYRRFFAHLFDFFGEINTVIVLKSYTDRPMDFKIYSQVFEKSGIPVRLIRPDELENNIGCLANAVVIDEINQMDLERLDLKLIEKIAASNSINNLQTKFLIHDKRFLSVVANPDFLSHFLNDQDIEFLIRHIIPTYKPDQRIDLWEQARQNKNNWLIKPYLLGKSEGLLAGLVTEEEKWERAFQSQETSKMVLQPFIRQKQYVGELGGRMYMDYVVGSMLCIDNEFLGPGRFRASSFPITNLGDDRKVAALIVDNNSALKSPFVL